jgi:hypothetical protein
MLQLPANMAQTPDEPRTGQTDERGSEDREFVGNSLLYCPSCAREVTDPLTCGDCSAVICRICGTPLESPEDLAMG